MGRGSEAPPPAPIPAPTFQPSEVRYGDTVVSKTYKDSNSGAIVTEYVPDPAEEQRKQEAQLKLNQAMSSLGQTAPELATRFDESEQAFVTDATQKFQEQYDPALRSLREDIASRFGTLNTSQFISGLNSLENNRAEAIADIVNTGKQIRSDLVNQDETRKLNEVQALGGILNDAQTTMLNNTQASLNASQAMNDFLNGQWVQQLRAYTADRINKRQLATSMFNNAFNSVVRTGMAFL